MREDEIGLEWQIRERASCTAMWNDKRQISVEVGMRKYVYVRKQLGVDDGAHVERTDQAWLSVGLQNKSNRRCRPQRLWVEVFTLSTPADRFHEDGFLRSDLQLLLLDGSLRCLRRIDVDYDATCATVHRNIVENIYGTYSVKWDVHVDVVF